MPIIALFNPSPACPDAWHCMATPGGYEWWTFDAEQADRSGRLFVRFGLGAWHDVQYRQLFDAYRKHPTRNAPPVPGDFPLVEVLVENPGLPAGQRIVRFGPEAFTAAESHVSVSIGPNRITSDAGGLAIHVECGNGEALGADLVFRPRGGSDSDRAIERIIPSRGLAGAEHRWIVGGGLWDVTGEIHLGERKVNFAGRGFHDHHYGTGPRPPGLRMLRGRVLEDGSTMAFQITIPERGHQPAEAEIVVSDEMGMRGVSIVPAQIRAKWRGNGAGQPTMIEIGDMLTLREPRVLDDAPRHMIFDAIIEGRTATARCEIP